MLIHAVMERIYTTSGGAMVVIWASWCLTTMATKLFVQQLIKHLQEITYITGPL